MNINELTEKNMSDAISLYRTVTGSFPVRDFSAISDEDIVALFKGTEENGNYTYMFSDRGQALAIVTISKIQAEILNMYVNHDVVDSAFYEKFLEFVVKQFSAITRVFIWVLSVDIASANMLEDYGFEYTGEQEYICKEKNLLKFRYVYKRKK